MRLSLFAQLMFHLLNYNTMKSFCLIALLLFAFSQVQSAVIYDNLGPPADSPGGLNISGFAVADDFTLGSSTSVTQFTFWAHGENADSDLSDSIGWAIFNNNSGAVGSLIASGTDTSVTKTDTGLDLSGDTIFKVDGDFGGAISLGADTFWISFRDGPWGAAYDGTIAGWIQSSGTSIGSSVRFDSNEENPIFPSTHAGNMHFQLFDNAIIPEPSGIALLGIGAIGLLGCRRRRRMQNSL